MSGDGNSDAFMSSIVRRAAAVPGVAVVALALCTLLWSRVAAASARPAAARGVTVGRRAVRSAEAVSRSGREWREEVFVLRKDMAAWANATGSRAGDKPISARNARDSWRGTVSCAGQTQARERGRPTHDDSGG
jgi:hypothetical protein